MTFSDRATTGAHINHPLRMSDLSNDDTSRTWPLNRPGSGGLLILVDVGVGDQRDAILAAYGISNRLRALSSVRPRPD